MRRKIILGILCVNILLGNTAYAADVSIEETGSVVTVGENIDKNSSAMLVVAESGKSTENNDNIYAVKYADANSEGLAVWEFEMPEKVNGELTDGEYDLYIKQDGKAVKKDTMIYATAESRENLKNEWSKVTSKENLAAILDNRANCYVLEVFGFDTDKYSEYSAYKTTVVENVYNTAGDFATTDIKSGADIFNRELGLSGLNNNLGSVSDNLTLINPEFEGTAYEKCEDSKLKNWICGNIGGEKYSTVSELCKKYETVNILYIINNTRVSDIEKILSLYADALGISESTEYKKYSALSNKGKADESIVNSLGAAPANDTQSLSKAIGKAVSGTTSTGTSGGSSGGSSSGGSGSSSASSGGVSSTIPTVSTGEETYFNDMDAAKWATEAVNELAKTGIVSGDENGNFRPNDVMTREEFVKMLTEAADVFDENAECGFDDVDKNAWYYVYVASAYKSGLAYGVSESKFGIGNKLTRQDMAVLSKRAAEKAGEIDEVREAVVFEDDAKIADYAKEAVYELYKSGAISGMDGNLFKPFETATRAQGAMIVYNLFLK